jgi:hypothetical protein
MKKLLLIISTIGLLECSDRGDQLCNKKFESKQFGVTIYHSDNWNPYEFWGNNIGLEYQGVENFERRYDAEIVITFFNRLMSEQEFYDTYAKKDTLRKIVESMGGSFESKAVDKGTTDFANKTWRTLRSEEKGSLQGESYISRETNYLWHTANRQISIRVRVRGKGGIEGLDDEVDCILSRLQFQELTAHNNVHKYGRVQCKFVI